jgi:hypothetical protein
VASTFAPTTCAPTALQQKPTRTTRANKQLKTQQRNNCTKKGIIQTIQEMQKKQQQKTTKTIDLSDMKTSCAYINVFCCWKRNPYKKLS